MRSLYAVRAKFNAVSQFFGGSILLAAMGLFSLQASAQWQDPLVTPAMPTLKATSSLLLDVVSTGDRLVAVGERGHIIYSDDDGYKWVQASVPVISTLTSVYFVNEQIGWAVGHDAIVLKTDDAGQTWAKQFDGFLANEMVVKQAIRNKQLAEDELSKAKVMGNSERISLAEESLENLTFALEDAQADFDSKSTKPLLDLWFKNEKEGFVVGAYGMIFKTNDGGANWQDWSAHVPNPDRFHLNAIANAGNNKLMIVGEAGLMLRTTDGGEQWKAMFSPYEGSFFGVTSLTEQGIQFAFGLRGNVARTDTFGSRWNLMDTGTEQSLIGATDRLGRVPYIVGNGGAFIKGIDLGRKWESKIRTGRTSAAAIVESNAGHFVLVGEGGVELLDKVGDRLSAKAITIEAKK